MRFKVVLALCVCVAVGCAQSGSRRVLSDTRGEAVANPPSFQDPPALTPTPAEDTARYVEWMNKRGTPVKDKPHEQVSLRFGDWGFFYHGDRPTGSFEPLRDRVALDRNGHALTEKEDGEWYAFLSADGLDAASALKRVAWLFNGEGLDPTNGSLGGNQRRITAPALTTKEGVVTFRGWVMAYSDPPYMSRITIVATKDRTKVTVDSGEKH